MSQNWTKYGHDIDCLRAPVGTWSSGFRRTFAMNCGLVRVLDKRLMMLLPYFCATRPAGELYIPCIPFKLEKGISNV